MDNRKYGNQYAMIPLWEGDIAYNESLMFVANPDGTVNDAPLMFWPEEILDCTSADGQYEYEEGVDFLVVDGKIRLTPNTRIFILPYDTYYPPKEIPNQCFAKNGGGFVSFGEGSFFHDRQVTITYRHNDPYTGFIPKNKCGLLPKTMERFSQSLESNLMFFGDSIVTGANSSGCPGIDVPPYLSMWPELVHEELEDMFAVKLNYSNTAVGGTASQWGVEKVQELFAPTVPDLAVIGFGMNDASGRVDRHQFIVNIKEIMRLAKELNPNMEFVLISTTLPNQEAAGFWSDHETHEPLLLELEGEGVAVVEMTSMHKSLLAKKRFYDMTGNNINHPNDYLARIYAHAIVSIFRNGATL